MDEAHREDIWDRRKPPHEIVREAKRIFDLSPELPGDHTALSVAYASVLKQYRSPLWKLPKGIWYAWRMVVHDMAAVRLGLQTADQADVVSNHFASAPWPFRNKNLARQIAACAVSGGYGPASPHTLALLYNTLAGLSSLNSFAWSATSHLYKRAIAQREAILSEPDKLMAERQWVRIAFEAGKWFFKNTQGVLGQELVIEARDLAKRVSRDQYEGKILPWLLQNGLDP